MGIRKANAGGNMRPFGSCSFVWEVGPCPCMKKTADFLFYFLSWDRINYFTLSEKNKMIS